MREPPQRRPRRLETAPFTPARPAPAAPVPGPLAATPRTGWDFSGVPLVSARHAGGERGGTGVPVQPRLTVGAPDDAYEREADRVADRVTRGEGPGAGTGGPAAPAPAVQRNPSTGQAAGLVAGGGGEARLGVTAPVQSSIEQVRQGSGEPLPASARADMEPHFGHDFSRVRVHAGGAAASSAAAIGARAFTVGRDIVFGAGQYRPESPGSRWLLAHELTHVVQQERGGLRGLVQADFAVEPTAPAAASRVLTATEIQSAITFNTATITDPQEIEMLRDILGLDPTPAVVDEAFVQAVADYQAQYGLTSDGKVGPATRRRLSREILAEAESLGFAGLGSLESGVRLRTDLIALIDAGNTRYADYRTRIRAATVLQRDVILAEPAMLRRLRDHLTTWDDFARCVELLGRRAPTFNELLQKRVVTAALATAWTDSTPGVNPPLVTQHEEGGWIYQNLITNVFTIRRQAAGAGAAINLDNPPVVADSIVVGMFHTHPNLGPGWTPGPSPADLTLDARDGVPDIVVGTPGVDPAVFTTFLSGPDRRLHLAGGQGVPGAGGGLAPQARADGTHDER